LQHLKQELRLSRALKEYLELRLTDEERKLTQLATMRDPHPFDRGVQVGRIQCIRAILKELYNDG